MNKKPQSLRFTLQFCSGPKPLKNLSSVSFSASKFTLIEVIKAKRLLQYSSSSRKKDSAPI